MHQTLVEALQRAAQGDSGIYLVESGERQNRLGYRELAREAERVLAGLLAAGVRPGDELVLQFADLRALIVTYWACLHGRIVPVPLEFAEQAAATEKVFAVWRTLATPWLATDSERLPAKFAAYAEANAAGELWEGMCGRLLSPLALACDTAVPPSAAGADDIALLQYSSGSTGKPKGVTLTHRNLLTNIGDLLASIGHAPGDRFLTWKPITHDFGMIAFHLAPVVAGSDQVRISTSAFIWNPALWFDKVHEHRASILGSPNFGYRHFLKLLRRGAATRPDWDLSCVKVILNGAEPISETLCEDFVSELAPYGLARAAMTPGYGLAEGSLVASLCPVSEAEICSISVDRRRLAIGEALRVVAPDADNAARFVDCGLAYPNTEIRITDAERRPLPDDHVGHIEIRGASVTAGYYRDPEASAETITADGWLNTQDLGAVRAGRLYVVGRVKEMIVIGGVNYFPHDIERAILREQGEDELNKYVALGVDDPHTGSEKLLLFVYCKRADAAFAELAAELRRIVTESFGLAVAHVVPTRRIPKTSSGKVQRFRLRREFLDGKFDAALAKVCEPAGAASDAGLDTASPALRGAERESGASGALAEPAAVLTRVRAIVAKLLGVADVDPDARFFDLGLGSLRQLELMDALEREFALALGVAASLDYPTVRSLARRIADALAGASAGALEPAAACDTGDAPGGDVAVVAMGCRFPGGADSTAAFWQLLEQGEDPVREVPAERWGETAAPELTTREGGFLDGIDRFDPLFFGISPTEAEALDPQQRLLLEVVHETIENAGWDPRSLDGSRTGVFVGISGSEYTAVGRDLGRDTGPYTFTGTMLNTAAGRISYTFGLQGPCVAIDTACSSSLVAIFQGMRELRAGGCDAVIAGGVNLILRADAHASFSQLSALSPSGRCRSFDDAADGYIRSEGCAMVLLKRLADAERDGDPVLAVIKGGAVNHNGRSGGLTVPSGPAQERLIRAALNDAGVGAQDVDYLEAHGSGTRLGDPQELGALAGVFGGRSRALRIGSVKSNIGHLESAAGVAGLIKVVLMLQHRRFAPNLHFECGNRLLDWSTLPLAVVERAEAWSGDRGRPRLAAISSFGIGGTNAHLVLSEHPRERCASAQRTGSHVFTLSARSRAGLEGSARAWLARTDLDSADFGALCATLNRSRSAQPWRFAHCAHSLDAVRAGLEHWLASGPDLEAVGREPIERETVFLFTGQGSIYPQVAQGLYAGSAVFRDAFERCDALFAPHIGQSLRECAASAAEHDTALVSQALIFTVEHAVAALWKSLGVRPTAVLGHSIGEYAAACEAGVVELADAVRMVARRGAIMDAAPADGAMAGLLTDEATARALVAAQDDVHIAAINADDNVTVSGSAGGMRALLAAARKARVFAEPLPMRHAFHTPRMHESAEQLAADLDGIRFRAPRVPFLSSQSGTVVDCAEAIGADYWRAHLCQPVRFRDALGVALQRGATDFVELGGTATLSGLAAQVAAGEGHAFLPSLRKGKDDWQQLNESLAALYLRGRAIDWDAYHAAPAAFVPGLPNTAYERRRCWFASSAASAVTQAPGEASAAAQAAPCAARAEASPATAADLSTTVVTDICAMTGRAAGLDREAVGADTNIFELGIDSLMLMQMNRNVIDRYGVTIPVKAFFAELSTPAQIAGYILEEMDEGVRAGLVPAEQPVVQAGEDSELQAIVNAQLDIMRQQLALLRGEAAVQHVAATPAPLPAGRRAARSVSDGENKLRGMTLRREDVDARQLAFICELVGRFVNRTPKSKAYAERYRGVFADWTATLNFSLTLKEMAYPVVAERSAGSRFWDIDGNEYIDTATGYGATFFGHNPPFITEAIREQLDRGIELGPQSGLAGEVAELICELTGMDRAAFCNSGTEAVMVALRLARAVTGRAKIVRFINAYHGSFDAVLAEAGPDGAAPLAPGIVDSMIQDTLVLPYGTPDSLETIRALGDELAAVLVEPVQSRAPTNHDGDYLRALRELTREQGTALIFDEIITGFRTHPRGVMGIYDIRADLATYGKVVGGGMPIGVVAGTSHFMAAIDGGTWQFGDDSGPSAETTFFAGTFCKHPLAMAAARAVLHRYLEEGEALIARVDDLTRRFCERANAFFAAEDVPIEAQHFGSLYRFETRLSQDPARSSLEMNLLFRLMMLDGVFVWERRTSFFSTAHTEEDADRILAAVRNAVHALRAGGFSLRRAKRELPTPATEEDGLPLSSEERRMYVLSLMRGGEYAYHVSGALRLGGRVEPDRVAEALAALLERHEILRASYGYRDEDVVRRIAGEVAVPLERIERGQRPLATVLAEFVRPFDLARAPLWRCALISADDDEHVLAFDFHHLICDGIAMTLLIEDFARLYRGETLAPSSDDYREFVRWEQAFATSDASAAERDYWLERLQPLPAPLALPSDFARPAHNDFAGESLRFVLDEEVRDAVRAFAREQRVTPFMVLLSTFFVLLHKLSRQRDLCVGTPFDRRGNGNFERTVGMFAQTVVLRVAAEPDLAFTGLLEEVRNACVEAYAQPNCSLDDLVTSLGVSRDFSRNPLFDAMFIFEDGSRRGSTHETLSIATVPVPARGSAFDLTLEITEQDGVLLAHFVYATRLFARETVQRWAGHYERLLREVLARPQASLAQISPLDADERSRLLHTFNDTQRPRASDETLVSQWCRSATAAPDRTALVFGDTRLSYRTLDAQAQAICAQLAAAGVRRGERVGILLPRGPAMIASMLGVLLAGAAYVPLAPDYPGARLAYMLDKSGARVLLSSEAAAAELAFTGTVIDPEALDGAAAAPVRDAGARPDDLAYVIFTSGSTGQPKGVMIEHASVVNFVHAMAEELALPPHPTVLGLTTVAFDIFVLEVFVTFAAGGTLVLADEHQQRDPQALARLIRRQSVSVVQATPSRVQSLLTASEAREALPGVEILVVGGEPFPPALREPLLGVPGLRLYNAYGPTETTVWSTLEALTAATEVTLGRPIANTRVYVLDEQQQPLPLGVVGELWIAGDGLARGYLDDPEKTAAAFVPDPFRRGERMYRTGDLAAWTTDGRLVHHGRVDAQVKLRGYRIELQEIEAVLQRHPAVALAAAAVREPSPGNAVLAAFCTPQPDCAGLEDEQAFASALREHAAQTLPAYMVPAAIVRLAALPHTPNGKIDRRNLPELPTAPPSVPSSSSSRTRAPEDAMDELETTIAGVWQRLLGERPIAAHDSFFDVGGNSFSLVRMHAALEELYPGALEVADIFANPTVAALRARIAERLAAREGQELPQALAFPARLLNAAGNPAARETLSVELDADTAHRLADVARTMDAEPFELIAALYGLYLSKLLETERLEYAVGLGRRAEYLLVELDFASVPDLQTLVDAVREQCCAQRRATRPLHEPTALAAHEAACGIRTLLLAGGGPTNARYGFDLTLRAQLDAGALTLRADFDSTRLTQAGVTALLGEYLRLIEALLGAARGKTPAPDAPPESRVPATSNPPGHVPEGQPTWIES